jgi:uracil-DNA glycosylase family 4
MLPPLTLEELRRLTRHHLEGLRLAGVEWLPLGEPVSIALTAPVTPPTPSPSKPSDPRPESELFAEPASPGTDLTLEQRRVALDVLSKEVAGCLRCSGLISTRTQTVFADGQAGAELCLVGEAPGADEDRQGVPFVGAAGQLLNKILAACGLRREEVYICNVLKCRPPNNRTPRPDEVGNCRDYFVRQLDLVRPKYIVALGGTAAQSLLGTNQSLGRLRGKFHDFRGIPVMVTYHPSFLLPHRSPEKKREVWEDMQWLMAKMGREIPGKKAP